MDECSIQNTKQNTQQSTNLCGVIPSHPGLFPTLYVVFTSPAKVYTTRMLYRMSHGETMKDIIISLLITFFYDN